MDSSVTSSGGKERDCASLFGDVISPSLQGGMLQDSRIIIGSTSSHSFEAVVFCCMFTTKSRFQMCSGVGSLFST